MKIAHFSDTHLGYRAYGRVDSGGLDQREVDVFQTFERFLESIRSFDPEIILHTGDVFNSVRPSNHTIVNVFRRITQLQAERSGRPFVIVAGNHETPRSAESGCILRLFGNERGTGGIPGVHIYVDNIGVFHDTGVECMCIPNRGLHQVEEHAIAPQHDEPVRLVAAHGLDSSLKLPVYNFDVNKFHLKDWSYVALGDYHVRKDVADNVAYCGSTDFTSTNIWEEISTPKGWFLFDSDSGKREFVPVAPVRRAFDLPVIDAMGLSGDEIAERMREAANWTDSSPIVRQRVVNAHPTARMEIPSQTFRELKMRTVHYRFDIYTTRADGTADTHVTGVRRLEEEWREFAAKRDVPAGVSNKELFETGSALLAEVSDEAEEA